MRVLQIGKYFPPYAGGMETYLRDLMAALTNRGIESSALVHRSKLSFKTTFETHAADEGQYLVTRAPLWARLVFTPISPTFPCLLRKLIKRDKPDILHLHMPNVSAFWALLLPSARRRPWVVQWHSDVLASQHSAGLRFFYSLYRPLEKAVLKRAQVIVVSSPPYLASSEPLAPFTEKCVVIPLGLDPAKITPPGPAGQPGESPERQDDKLRVLALGRLSYYKGFDYLIAALADTNNVALDIVGRGDRETSLKEQARRLGLQDRVRFHGQLPDDQLAVLFQQCDCLCLPSIERTEAFGLVLLEAMYLARATIASDVPGSGMGWIVDHQETGLKVPPRDSASLASALRRLQGNRDKISEFGARGRAKFDHMFHISKSAAATAGLYAKLLEET